MNLAHSNGKPGAFASNITLNVRFVPSPMIKFKIKVFHENMSSKPLVPIFVIANRGAIGKACHFWGTGPQYGAIC
jgi:hypothetical protein